MPQHPKYGNDSPDHEDYSDIIRDIASKLERPGLTDARKNELKAELEYLFKKQESAKDYFFDDFLTDQHNLEQYPQLCCMYLPDGTKNIATALRDEAEIARVYENKPLKASPTGPKKPFVP